MKILVLVLLMAVGKTALAQETAKPAATPAVQSEKPTESPVPARAAMTREECLENLGTMVLDEQTIARLTQKIIEQDAEIKQLKAAPKAEDAVASKSATAPVARKEP